jgi:hypothetical protein
MAAAPPASGAATTSRRLPVKTIVIALIVIAVAVALTFGVVVPRLFPSVEPQKFVGTWEYTSGAAGKITITRMDKTFTITFIAQDNRQQPVPGAIKRGKLVLDYGALGPNGQIVQKLADSVGAKLSFAYQAGTDGLLMTAGSAAQGTATIPLRRVAQETL